MGFCVSVEREDCKRKEAEMSGKPTFFGAEIIFSYSCWCGKITKKLGSDISPLPLCERERRTATVL